ncbi:endonuclease/exonuclease/phosphatase [Didymella exigua CBS 183.55]|uniref:Endonuclease/exonuclease/phosphatase n=1 Tax=Didymella exigua CBS 183.55 TaxID=1150837 RepID=A0A6A5RW93_9PLEO|nr:endonuclease/exonuclease/phosphatase [Didymella exigua CBS 183.55]KAF1931570.1 endonuclease/exonuclease/phosphatase [Didymella exigua CBS 183.55]
MKAHAALPIRILTHNIRYATKSPFKGEKPWSDRKHLIVNELKYTTAHNPEAFICLQEVLHGQLIDILSGLNSTPSSAALPAQPRDPSIDGEKSKYEWTYIGVGRDDGLQAGEYSPIIYRPAIWKLDRWKSVWLSPTPDRPGKGWDAGSVRIVTVGHFTHQGSKKSVVGLCTHFDEQGEVSRRESARIIQGIVRDAGKEPVWLAGDLNSEMDGEAYRNLNGEESTLGDARGEAKWRYGNEITCTGFQQEEMTVIDYVFVSKQGWSVEGFSVLPNRFEDGVYSSDHRAVVVDAVLNI